MPVRVAGMEAFRQRCLGGPAGTAGELPGPAAPGDRPGGPEGNIDADPCCHSEDDSYCQYCDWAGACHFQDGRDGDHLHYILPVKAEEFWKSLEEES